MNQKITVYGVSKKELEHSFVITVNHDAELHHRLVRLKDRIMIPPRRRLKDFPALSRSRKINKSLLDFQTLLLELFIPTPDGLSKTVNNVEIHLKSPQHPKTRVFTLFFECSAHAADKIVLYSTLTGICGKEVNTREDFQQGRFVLISPLSVISAAGAELLVIPTETAVVLSRHDDLPVVIYIALENTHAVDSQDFCNVVSRKVVSLAWVLPVLVDAQPLASCVEALVREDSCTAKLVNQLLDVHFHALSKLERCVGSQSHSGKIKFAISVRLPERRSLLAPLSASF
jgi:hypothetical protein